MEKVQRKILLEEFRNRFVSESADTPEWGAIAKDVAVDSGETEILEIADRIPIINGVLRYRNMLNLREWIKDMLKDAKLLQLCKRGDVIRFNTVPEFEVEDLCDANVLVSDNSVSIFEACVVESGGTYEMCDEDESGISTYAVIVNREVKFLIDSGITLGTYIFFFFLADEVIAKFKIDDDGEDYSKIFCRMDAFLKFAEKNKMGGDVEPYFDIPIFIESESEDMGLFTSIMPVWEEGKRYYLNDKAMNSEGVVYQLTEGTELEEYAAPAVLHDFIAEQINVGAYILVDDAVPGGIYGDTAHTYVKLINSTYYYVAPYYIGEIDDEHWEKCKGDDTEEVTVCGVTESRILSLKKVKKDYDDNGNQLPFSVLYDMDYKGPGLRLVTTRDSTEENPIYSSAIQFDVGVATNVMRTEEGTYYFNYIEEILTAETITFIYHMGVESPVIDPYSVSATTGIVYTEEYPYEIKEGVFKYSLPNNGDIPEKKFRYEFIDFDNPIKISMDGVPLSDIYGTYTKDAYYAQAAPYMKDEALLGIQEVKGYVGKLIIDRGKSAAFERHNVLGEVSSFEELKNYKNGFFTLRDDENNQ